MKDTILYKLEIICLNSHGERIGLDCDKGARDSCGKRKAKKRKEKKRARDAVMQVVK